MSAPPKSSIFNHFHLIFHERNHPFCVPRFQETPICLKIWCNGAFMVSWNMAETAL